MPGKKIFDVDRPHTQRDQTKTQLHGAREADEQKHVEPCRHKGEVDQAADRDERAGHERHLPPVVKIDQQRQQKQQDPHGARVEAVQQADGDRKQRQPQLADTYLTEPTGLDAVGGGLSLGMRSENVVEFLTYGLSSSLGRMKADNELRSDYKRRNAD